MGFRTDDYKIGDLVILKQPLEWEDVTAYEGELCIVVELYMFQDEESFFDLLLVLADGCILPVWVAEIEKIQNES